MIALETADGVTVCERCVVADRPWSRLRGLMGRRALGDGEGLLVRPAASIHTCFMRFSIDVVFLDADDVVVGVAHRVRPWRLAGRRGARQALELPAGSARRAGLRPGLALVRRTPARHSRPPG